MPSLDERPAERPNLSALSDVTRRDFLAGSVAAGVVAGGSLGAFYFGYGRAVGCPVRVGVIGTGDEGSVLIGAITPEYLQVKAIADVRPYNVHRALHGDYASEADLEARPGLLAKYGWKSEAEARRHVKVYGTYQELIAHARADGLEGVIIALPLHLHAPAAIAAMRAGLHVMTEKLMAHSVHECKEMARVAQKTERLLATGHQRHYNLLYQSAVDTIQRGTLGDLHYIRAQWHRGNLPGKDSWQQPLPPEIKPQDPQARKLVSERDTLKKEISKTSGTALDTLRKRLAQVEAQLADKILQEKDQEGKTLAARLGYEDRELKDAAGKIIYERPAAEELIRWRLWDRTGGGLMAELGSHQLDAASIFIAAEHGGVKQYPLSVAAAANRPLFPTDRDCEDHVFCIFEFPAPGYDPQDSLGRLRKIGVQYTSINGNGFGGYGEIVYGTQGTLILAREQELTVVKGPAAPSSVKVAGGAPGGPTLDTQASGAQGPAIKGKAEKLSRGYTEELEHWAWCIRHPAAENQPRCGPKVALGDAVIALTSNMAARQGARMEFQKEWFDPDRDETPENVKPDLGRYT